MNLEYKILWIDDHPRQVEHAKQFVLERLARKGFKLEVKFLNNVSSAQSLKSHFTSDYDLLAIDYQMSNGSINGDQVVKAIRNYCPLTEIVFYSSSSPQELREKMWEQKAIVDGVYYANRQNLPERLNDVIGTTIKKALDLNQMRGLFLSCVADFDHIIEEIITTAFEKIKDDDVKTSVKEKIRETAITYHTTSKEVAEKISKEDTLEKFLTLLSSDPKHTILYGLLQSSNDESLDSYCVKIANYVSDIIQPRNKLAHYMKKEEAQGRYTLVSKDKTVTFDDEAFQTLRHRLLHYRDSFEQIKNSLSN